MPYPRYDFIRAHDLPRAGQLGLWIFPKTFSAACFLPPPDRLSIGASKTHPPLPPPSEKREQKSNLSCGVLICPKFRSLYHPLESIISENSDPRGRAARIVLLPPASGCAIHSSTSILGHTRRLSFPHFLQFSADLSLLLLLLLLSSLSRCQPLALALFPASFSDRRGHTAVSWKFD